MEGYVSPIRLGTSLGWGGCVSHNKADLPREGLSPPSDHGFMMAGPPSPPIRVGAPAGRARVLRHHHISAQGERVPRVCFCS